MVPESCSEGVRAMMNMPHADSVTKIRIRRLYGILCIKYGAHSFVRKDGMTSQRRTTPLGTEGPTRSRAAERMITYRTLLMRPAAVLACFQMAHMLMALLSRANDCQLDWLAPDLDGACSAWSSHEVVVTRSQPSYSQGTFCSFVQGRRGGDSG